MIIKTNDFNPNYTLISLSRKTDIDYYNLDLNLT